jgi:hypothetical protein
MVLNYSFSNRFNTLVQVISSCTASNDDTANAAQGTSTPSSTTVPPPSVVLPFQFTGDSRDILSDIDEHAFGGPTSSTMSETSETNSAQGSSFQLPPIQLHENYASRHPHSSVPIAEHESRKQSENGVWLADEMKSVGIIDNYITIPASTAVPASLRSLLPSHYPTPAVLFSLRNFSVHWRMFGGSDFDRSGTPTSSRKPAKPQQASSASDSAGQKLPFGTVVVPSYAQPVPTQPSGKGSRKDREMMEIRIDGLNLLVHTFDEATTQGGESDDWFILFCSKWKKKNFIHCGHFPLLICIQTLFRFGISMQWLISLKSLMHFQLPHGTNSYASSNLLSIAVECLTRQRLASRWKVFDQSVSRSLKSTGCPLIYTRFDFMLIRLVLVLVFFFFFCWNV